MQYVYAAVFYPLEKTSGYRAVIPDLPGCTAEGVDLGDAIERAADAAADWIQCELRGGRIPPEPSPLAEIRPDDPSGFVNAISLDMPF
jgi:predicted RNase H-like HicB family nuclease